MSSVVVVHRTKGIGKVGLFLDEHHDENRDGVVGWGGGGRGDGSSAHDLRIL